MPEYESITPQEIRSLFKKRIKPLSFEEILSLLKIQRKNSKTIKRLLNEMVNKGELVRTRKGHYGPPDEMNLVTGYFEAHGDGYGFVIPEKPGERDIFIPARATGGAMDSDRVIARIEEPERRAGRIIKILERVHKRISGIFEYGRYGSFVRPKNRTLSFDIYIPPNARGGAKNNDHVIAEIVEYPSDSRAPVGKVIKVLKKPDTPIAEIESIIEEFNLQNKFPPEVNSEAREVRKKDIHRKDRKDLTNLITVTIDGENAKDFDDAISIRKLGENYLLYVHIADVGYFVPWNSNLDREARKRATSVYFPDRAIPMLPRELSEDLCSLKPGVERAAFTVEILFSKNGERLNVNFYPSVIKSSSRLTYTSVKKILIDKEPSERTKYTFLLPHLEVMEELARILREKRIERGSLDFDLPEPEVILDIQGRPENIIKAERTFAHMIIEEFMIAANEAVAEYLESLCVPSIYRIHEKPDPLKMQELAKILKNLTGRKLIKTSQLSSLIKEMKGSPHEELVNYILLRSLKQARYSPENAGHFGLASRCYTHFTSPIRRYPDLVVHRILRDVLTNRLTDKKIKDLEEILPSIAFHSSRMERLADEAERTVIDAMRVWFMKEKIGEEFRGNIISLTPYGMKVRLKDFYVEGFLHVSYMTDDFYIYDQETLTLIGRKKKKLFRIGDEVTVRIERVDEIEREIILALV
ncbi:MAG: ribonuclease R [Thermodesulfovibrionales bacterium]|nr:ribonuclease R [Thermodesulfovibrionales bacterium]